jgi:hypothetical protein
VVPHATITPNPPRVGWLCDLGELFFSWNQIPKSLPSSNQTCKPRLIDVWLQSIQFSPITPVGLFIFCAVASFVSAVPTMASRRSNGNAAVAELRTWLFWEKMRFYKLTRVFYPTKLRCIQPSRRKKNTTKQVVWLPQYWYPKKYLVFILVFDLPILAWFFWTPRGALGPVPFKHVLESHKFDHVGKSIPGVRHVYIMSFTLD